MKGGISSFGGLLSAHRTEANLTQEALSVRAGLSVDAISMLERGVRQAPRATTVALLADALRLSAEDREAFIAAAQRRTEPPARQPPRAPLELQTPPTPLIGRDEAVAHVCALLARSDVPLLTLTGPPGVGKTRLALEAALRLGDDFADGVVAVALGPVQSAELVPVAIRRALGLREMANVPPLDTVLAFCRDRHLLLVLDTFEHLPAATPLVIELINQCPAVRLLVTSRAPLRIRGEQELPVPPLRLPRPDDVRGAGPEALASVPAVALFVQRVSAAAPGFQLDACNAAAVAGICRRLDGLPLALELAAPWIKVMTPDALQERLERRLGLLVEGPRDLPERQRTMRGTLAWSHELLDGAQRAVLRRMSVFAASAPLDAIESVCQAAGEVAGGVLPGLARLIEHSLALRDERPAGQARVVMLETVREYGRELLEAAGEVDVTMRACSEYYIALALRGLPRLMGADQASWLRRLEWEHDNVQAVLEWAVREGHRALGLRLAVAAWRYWYLSGHRRDGLSTLELLLAGAGEVPLKLRAEALGAAGTMAWAVGALELSLQRQGESLEVFRQLNDQRGVANALNGLGIVTGIRGEYRRAASLFEEALSLYRAVGHQEGVAQALGNLATAVDQLGNRRRGRALHTESLRILRRLGSPIGIALSLVSLGELARFDGDLDHAEAWLREAVDLVRDLDAPYALAFSLSNLADVERLRGNAAAARAHYAGGIRRFLSIGDQVNVASCIERVALLDWAESRPESAARLYGAAAALRQAIGSQPQPAAYSEHERALEAIREELGPAAFAAAHAAGAERSLGDVLVEVLGHDA